MPMLNAGSSCAERLQAKPSSPRQPSPGTATSKVLPKGERGGKLPSQTAPLASGQESSRALPLLGENKYLGFAFEAQFKHSAVFVGYDHRVRRLLAAVFPASRGFRDHFLAVQKSHVVVVDHGAVIAGLHVHFAEFYRVRNRKRLCHRFGEHGNREREGGREGHTANQRIAFHVHLSFRGASQPRLVQNGRSIDTQPDGESPPHEDTSSSWSKSRKNC